MHASIIATVRRLAPALLTLATAVAQDVPPRVWTEPAAAIATDADFRFQGEYLAGDTGAQIVALGEGEFDCHILVGGLPGAGWEPGKPRISIKGTRQGRQVSFRDEAGTTTALLRQAKLAVTLPDGAKKTLSRIVRRSPTLGAKPPKGAVVLFDGTSTGAWENGRMKDGHLLSTGATSKRLFRDYRLHAEFRTPYMPAARGQKRGNSGIYHSGRWENQVLDSFGLDGREDHCGGIYSIAKPRLNMCLPPLSWQTYDIEFTAAKFDESGNRTAWPRITVKLNGVVVHQDVELSKDFTTSAPITAPLDSPDGPIHIQNHNDPVAYRNIWLMPGR